MHIFRRYNTKRNTKKKDSFFIDYTIVYVYSIMPHAKISQIFQILLHLGLSMRNHFHATGEYT